MNKINKLIFAGLLGICMPNISEEIQNSTIQHDLSLSGLEPQLLWNYFGQISQIPRGSGNESAIADFIISYATNNNCEAFKDNVGNVVVRKAASAVEYQKAPIVVIQSHLDMVCEKNKNIEHNFFTDPIQFMRKDNFLYAQGTTLGADNGIGVAASLAIIGSNDLAHGPLELLFTIKEETTFEGAKNINSETIKGRILLNIDTEEDGSIYVGCAGMTDVVGKVFFKKEQLTGSYNFVSILVDGLRGGHSGVDIDKDRVNALKIANIILQNFNEIIKYRLVSIDGGNKRNAIARDIEFVLAIPTEQIQLFENVFSEIQNDLLNKYKTIEHGMTIEKKYIEQNQDVLDYASQEKIIHLLNAVPHGIIKMSSTIENMVETSTNLAQISTKEDCVVFETSQRSLIGSEMKKMANVIAQMFETVGVKSEIGEGSPEWQPNENSVILKKAKQVYENIFNKKPLVKAIHAGLECGAFVGQIEGLDAISFGPTIHDAHSPNEHIDVDAVKPFWVFLTGLLADVCK